MLNINNEISTFSESGFQMMGNVKVGMDSKQKVLDQLCFRLSNRIKTSIFFLNAHCFNIAQKNTSYLKNVNTADFVLNDGIGVELGARALGISFRENMNGTDFTPEVLKILNQKNMSLYLLGGNPGVAELAAENIKKDFPDIILKGTCDGFFKDSEEVLAEINQVKPDLLLVGMGVPLQENWIAENLPKLDVTLIMAVGAYLDFASGRISRAPGLIRKFRMEWIYRLMLEPRRMFKRYIIGNAVFFIHIIKFATVKNPKI